LPSTAGFHDSFAWEGDENTAQRQFDGVDLLGNAIRRPSVTRSVVEANADRFGASLFWCTSRRTLTTGD
jgi:hypothetical protein